MTCAQPLARRPAGVQARAGASPLLPLQAAALALLLAACEHAPREPVVLAGATMGSAWTVKVAGPLPLEVDALRAGVQAQFDAVDGALSTYRADSALSRFNAAPHGDWQAVDPELLLVMGYALRLGALSEGAYDVTIGPLVDLWGFGPAPRREAPPSDEDIARVRALVGWQQVEVDEAAGRARRPPGVRVDLSSLGKGRGVDRVALWLESVGVHDYLIDLSGKLRAGGVNAQGQPWRVAVEAPEDDDPSGEPRLSGAVVSLQDESIATAGDYRRYFESGGSHYSHLIDPATGRPIDRDSASATARAPDCLSADAWATVFTVLPAARALALADAQQVPALVIVREQAADGAVVPGLRYSRSWQATAP